MNYPNGFISWTDLATTDVEAARAFYQDLLGWTSQDIPTDMGPAYTQFYRDGKLVAGMGPQPPDLAKAGVPSAWNTYVSVDSVDETVAKVDPAGGSVVMPPMDVMTAGRMAMVADPSGAVLGLWQAGDHKGAEVFNTPGAMGWNDLQTRDLAAAMPFYEKVFGWRFEEGEKDYMVAMLDTKEGDDKSLAGAMTIPPGVPAEMPSVWVTYFTVEDLDATLEKAKSLGGSVAFPPMAGGGVRFAGINDPTGAFVSLAEVMPS